MSNHNFKEECDLAINAVARKITIGFPQYPQFGEIFKSHCIEEAYDELDTLIDDFQDGFNESTVLEAISHKIDIKNEDKEILCNEIHYILSHLAIPPTGLNLGMRYIKNKCVFLQ